MIMQDKLEKERNDAKNAVEEYVYDMRDKLCGIYEKFVSEDVSVAAWLSSCCVLLHQTVVFHTPLTSVRYCVYLNCISRLSWTNSF